MYVGDTMYKQTALAAKTERGEQPRGAPTAGCMFREFATALGVQLDQQLQITNDDGSPAPDAGASASDDAPLPRPYKRGHAELTPGRLGSSAEFLEAVDGLGQWHSAKRGIAASDVFATLGDPLGDPLATAARGVDALAPRVDDNGTLSETRDEHWEAGARVALPIYAAATLADAVARMLDALRTQVERAVEVGAPAQRPIDGDNATRIAFLTLFHVRVQRRIFMASYTRDLLTRMRCLFGSPPYAFLRRTDLDALEAKAISRGRANIGLFGEVGNAVVGWGQFGYPHLVDHFGRLYRLDQGADDADTTLVALHAVRAISQSGASMRLLVRIGRRTRQARQKLQRREEGAENILFPRAGEVLEMEEDERLCRYMAAERGGATAEPRRYTVVVLRTHQRRSDAATGEVEVRLR